MLYNKKKKKINKTVEASSLSNKEEALTIKETNANTLQVNKLLKKNKITLIALISCIFIITIFIIGGILLFVNRDNEDSIFYKVLRFGNPAITRNIWIEDFDEAKDFEVLIRWEKVFSSTGYTLEYIYESLYPEEINSVDTLNNGILIERKRGYLKYRVRAKNGDKLGEYSQWQNFYIKPLVINKVDVDKIDYYQSGNTIIFSWTPVNYKYYNVEGIVPSYEIVDAHRYGDETDYTENESLFTKSGLHKYEIIIKKTNEYIGDVLRIRIRPINYTVFFTTKEEKVLEPTALYELYGITSNWIEVDIEIEKQDY